MLVLGTNVIRSVGRNGSLAFAEGLACVSGKSKCAQCAVGKIKNTEGSAMSVGLFVVRLFLRFYVLEHLSKCGTFFFFCSSLSAVLCGFTLCGTLL